MKQSFVMFNKTRLVYVSTPLLYSQCIHVYSKVISMYKSLRFAYMVYACYIHRVITQNNETINIVFTRKGKPSLLFAYFSREVIGTDLQYKPVSQERLILISLCYVRVQNTKGTIDVLKHIQAIGSSLEYHIYLCLVKHCATLLIIINELYRRSNSFREIMITR